MTSIVTSILTDRTFHFSWLPESIEKVCKCIFDCISHPLERKLIGNFTSLWGWGRSMDIFWNHTTSFQLSDHSFQWVDSIFTYNILHYCYWF